MLAISRLHFYFKNRFDLDRRIGWDLGKPESAPCMITVAGLSEDLMEQIAATIDNQVLFVEFKR